MIANPADASTTCTGGVLTATAGDDAITYDGGGSVAGGATCTVTVDVTSSTVGDHANASGALTSSLGDSGSATATLTVSAAPAPAFSKVFAPDLIASGDTGTLTFTIDNSASLLAATSLAFTDTLPAGVVIATPADASTTCSGGALTATAGDDTITYAGGGSVAAGETCTVTVDVTSSTAGAHANTSGALTSSLGASGPASATLTVTETAFSVESATGSGTITGVISSIVAGCEIASVSATTPEAEAGSGPAGATFLHGLIDIQIEGCSPGSEVTFSVTFPDALPAGTVYWKYGPTPSNATPDWYTLPASIAGDTVTYTITDGNLGDDDLTANGTIADPGGPAMATAVPAMPLWMLAGLALVLVVIARRAFSL